MAKRKTRKNNPWAICQANINKGRMSKRKKERCIKKIKQRSRS
jgi:hypothetical protein